MGNTTLLPFYLPIFGISVMSALLGVKRSDFTKRNVWILTLFVAFVLLINVLVFVYLGRELYSKFYVLWVQLPFFIAFSIISHHQGSKIFFTLLTTITLCSLPVRFVLAFRVLFGTSAWIMTTGFLISYIIMLYIVFYFLRPNFLYMLEYQENKEFWKFCIIPLLYYFYGFLISEYKFYEITELRNFIIKNIPDLIVVVSYILLIDIFKNTREKEMLESEQKMLESQMATAHKQMEFLEATQQQAALYRHDLRHHVSLINGYLHTGEIDKIKEYLEQTKVDIESITPVRYCENNTVNLMMLSFANQAKLADVTLVNKVQLPHCVGISETKLCSVISNALENAIQAASKVEERQKRIVFLSCEASNERLLLYVKNTYTGMIEFKDGLPRTKEAGHGLGTKSIADVVDQCKGLYEFETDEHYFYLRVVLPLKRKKVSSNNEKKTML